MYSSRFFLYFLFFFFNDTATTEIYTLSLHDALPISRGLVQDHAPAQRVIEGSAGVEQDDRVLGDLAGEAYGQAQAEAQVLWRGVQDLADAWQLRHSGLERMEKARTAAQGIWRDTTDAERLRDVGREAAED